MRARRVNLEISFCHEHSGLFRFLTSVSFLNGILGNREEFKDRYLVLNSVYTLYCFIFRLIKRDVKNSMQNLCKIEEEIKSEVKLQHRSLSLFEQNVPSVILFSF